MSQSALASIETVLGRVRPRRAIQGISALLLPFHADRTPDYASFTRHVERTARAGLIPAVNMDTGYVNLISEDVRSGILDRTQQVLGGGPFVAGCWAQDGSGLLLDRYRDEIARIQDRGGIPILFQCDELRDAPESQIVELHRLALVDCDHALAFELGEAFTPFGRIYSLETISALMEIRALDGLKHSSLRRDDEWARLALRDEQRPDFRIYTGNDLAIDMVMYGSDYLLGLSTFDPDAFALRDRYWEQGDTRFFELNDRLQFLGAFAFRSPTPAYRHSAAQYLRLAGAIESDTPPAGAPTRPSSDIEVLCEIRRQIEDVMR